MLESLIIDVDFIQKHPTVHCPSEELLDKLLGEFFDPTQEPFKPISVLEQQVLERQHRDENINNQFRGPNYLLANGGLGVDPSLPRPDPTGVGPSTRPSTVDPRKRPPAITPSGRLT